MPFGTGLLSVQFTGDQTIDRDNGDGAYSGPQWVDKKQLANGDGVISVTGVIRFTDGTEDGGSDEHQYPVSYARNIPGGTHKLKATVNFNFDGNVGNDWQLVGTDDNYTFTSTTITQEGGELVAAVESDQPIPSVIASSDLKISWQLIDPNNQGHIIGTSDNHLFVTGVETSELAETPFETSLYLGCEGAMGTRPPNPDEMADGNPTASGLTHINDVVNGVWSMFSTGNGAHGSPQNVKDVEKTRSYIGARKPTKITK